MDTGLSALAQEVADELGIVGAQIALLNGTEVTEGVAGVESLRTRVPVGTDTLFQIGSTTKVHTAMLVMQLVEQGLIGLDAPVCEQMPFRLSDQLATTSVTPRHLMSMSSGIDNGPYSDLGPGDDALVRYVASLADLPQVYSPGNGFGYSNASTCVSGRLVEHVTGQTWEDALRTRLLEPCGLEQSFCFASDVIVRPHALGHTAAGEQLDTWSVGRALGPAGMLVTSAGDLARLARVFCDEGRALDGTAVLTPASVTAMAERVTSVPPTLLAQWWGLGIYGKVWDGVEVMGHSGTNLSGSSYVLWAPERGVAIATTVNTPSLGYPFAKRAFAELFGSEAGITVPETPQPPAHVDVDPAALVGRYAMSQQEFTVTVEAGGLVLTAHGQVPGWTMDVRCDLVPMTDRTFLPTDPVIDGGRGWAIAFVGPEDGPADLLVNGFFAMRRVA